MPIAVCDKDGYRQGDDKTGHLTSLPDTPSHIRKTADGEFYVVFVSDFIKKNQITELVEELGESVNTSNIMWCLLP